MIEARNLINDPRLKTFKEIDRLHRLPKGAAFRAFKRFEPQWVEGLHFWCCDSRSRPEAFAELQSRGRIYPSTVNAVLIGEAAYGVMAEALPPGAAVIQQSEKVGAPMIHPIVVSQFSKVLGNLQAILDKAENYAEERKFEVDVLLQARLAPDQFNLMRQIQIACDTAKLGAARLADKEKDAPSHPDTEHTLAEIKARLASVMSYLAGFSADDFAGAAARRITQPRWKGKTLSGEEFLLQHALPNFYFHVTTAYAILRHNGVPVGKGDYLGALPYRE